MAGKQVSSILTQFLSEHVVVYLNQVTTVQTEDGNIIEHPMLVEGVLVDYDESFALLDFETSIGAINFDSIIKIDLANKATEVMMDPDKPKKSQMN